MYLLSYNLNLMAVYHVGYECERQEPAADVPPPCASDGSYVCYNNGILTYEASKCWCLCHPEWQGNHDCSKPTGYDPVIVVDSDAICK